MSIVVTINELAADDFQYKTSSSPFENLEFEIIDDTLDADSLGLLLLAFKGNIVKNFKKISDRYPNLRFDSISFKKQDSTFSALHVNFLHELLSYCIRSGPPASPPPLLEAATNTLLMAPYNIYSIVSQPLPANESEIAAQNELIKQLKRAISTNSLDDIRQCIEHGVNLENKIRGNYPLHLAVKKNSFDIVEMLIRAGAPINSLSGSENNTALHIAVAQGNIKLAEYLIAQGANLNQPNKFDHTVLHLAVKNANLDMVQLLLKHQTIDVNAVSKTGDTALHFASMLASHHESSLKIVKALLDGNVNSSITNKIGQTASDLACKYGFTTALELFPEEERLKTEQKALLEQAAADEFFEATNHASQEVLAGISSKYLGGKIPLLPERSYQRHEHAIDPEIAIFNENKLNLTQIKSLTPISQSLRKKIPFSTSRYDDLEIDLDLHTHHPNIAGTDRLIFIFSGRKEEAYIPQIDNRVDSNVRIILVGTTEEFEQIQQYLQIGIDFLELKKIRSLAHGEYEILGLLNSRRIAAFYVAMYLNREIRTEHAIMLDDNLISIHASQALPSWPKFFDIFAAQSKTHKAACVSLATFTHQRLRPNRPGELGSKIFMLNLEAIAKNLSSSSAHWLLPFYPASANNMWGEDYFMQLILSMLFADSKEELSGYKVLNSSEFGIRRASLQSLCSKHVKKADSLCHTSVEELFGNGYERLSQMHQQLVGRVHNTLTTLIQSNVERYERLLNHNKTTDLMRTHAVANKISYNSMACLPDLNEAEFLIELGKQINNIMDHCNLRPYQKELLQQFNPHLTQDNIVANLIMATGTGKTFIQIYLAIAALLTGTKRPIVIVTPYQQLVQQAYEDFMGVLETLPEEYPVNKSQIIKVDGRVDSVSPETLILNRSLDNKPCVLIFCQNSYQMIQNHQEHPAIDRYKTPAMLLIDEAHLQRRLVKMFSTTHANATSTFIAGLTATPCRKEKFWQKPGVLKLEYSRQQAIQDNVLAPCILDYFGSDYGLQAVLDVIKMMPTILEQITPNGKKLKDSKGIIYIPNNDNLQNISYSSMLKQSLDTKGIKCYEINSDEPDAQANLTRFKASKPGSPNILICKGMAKIGYSDKAVEWVIYLQTDNPSEFTQSAGRAMRFRENKIAYILAFKSVDSSLIFAESQNDLKADAIALERANSAYLELRQSHAASAQASTDSAPAAKREYRAGITADRASVFVAGASSALHELSLFKSPTVISQEFTANEHDDNAHELRAVEESSDSRRAAASVFLPAATSALSAERTEPYCTAVTLFKPKRTFLAANDDAGKVSASEPKRSHSASYP
ncbi:ankyrin repeat domain-containing protein [Legionella yabuuchiae]|uniref:ankyrin repeat domain-containing protein n=1 Tax=Legionella yabuuchiae TaxID=376727 RepID=UPI001055BECE|nr:ankyrin repeat domain-containing protein [Legionella yabuuchiae]